jgi:hypothetical protein
MGDRTKIADALEQMAVEAEDGYSIPAGPSEVTTFRDAARLLRADPDTSDELAAEARQLLDAANTAPRSHRCPDGMVDDVISWRCQCCGEWQVDFGPQTDCAAAPEPKMVHAPVRLIAALLAERDADVSAGAVARTVAMSHIAAERDAERAARERAETEARQLREGVEKLVRWAESYRMHHTAIALRNLLAAVAEVAEDRGQTDG